MILTELSETGGYFLSKPAKHSYTLAKALTAQLMAVTSVAPFRVSHGGCARAILAAYIRVPPPLSDPEIRTEPPPV